MTIATNAFLTSTGFKVSLDSSRFPGLNCTIQNFPLPGVSAPGTGNYETPRRNIPMPGDKYLFDPLTVTMILKEDFSNYETAFDWLKLCVETPDDPLSEKTSDIRLTIYNNKNNVSKTLKFVSAFPSDLGQITFDTTDASDEYLTCTVTFQYAYFDIE